jgi:hypothetical protein
MRSAIPPDLPMTNIMGGAYAGEDEHKSLGRAFRMSAEDVLDGRG